MRFRVPRAGRIGMLGLLILMGVPGCGGNSAQACFDRGASRYRHGKFDEAIEAYTKGLALDPHSAVGHNLLGMAYRGKFNATGVTEWKEKEIASFRLAVEADSTFWPAYINLGASLYYMGRKAEAAPFFTRALVLHPDNPEREQLETFIREGGGQPPAGSVSASD